MIKLIAIGKNKDKALQSLEKEYMKRLSAFCKFSEIEVKDEANEHISREAEVLLVKEKEGNRVLEKLSDQDFVVLLDLHGKMIDSETFAKNLDMWQMKHSNIVFVIAGSLGPSEKLVSRANYRWKLSDLTFTHLMTRVLMLEQIYRGFMINNGRLQRLDDRKSISIALDVHVCRNNVNFHRIAVRCWIIPMRQRVKTIVYHSKRPA